VQNQNVNYVFRVFGRPPRTTACDCERSMDPALPQKLFLLADPNLDLKFRAPSNRLATVLKEKKDDMQALDELFLATLTRRPNQKERDFFVSFRAEKHPNATTQAAARRELFADVLWALINTKEFILNH